MNSAPTVLPRLLINFAVCGEMSSGQFWTISRQVKISWLGNGLPSSHWISCIGAMSSGDGGIGVATSQISWLGNGLLSSELEFGELELMGSWRPSPSFFPSRFITLNERSSSTNNYCGRFRLQVSVKPCAPALELEVEYVSLASLVIYLSCLTYKRI
jgi:hypothetical protein